jgi:hypothetical protein
LLTKCVSAVLKMLDPVHETVRPRFPLKKVPLALHTIAQCRRALIKQGGSIYKKLRVKFSVAASTQNTKQIVSIHHR